MITVSLETAKKLQKAGWKKRTYFYYCYSKKGGVFNLAKVSPTSCVGIFAPTAQEILDELPTVIEVGRIEYMLTMTKKSALYLDLDIEGGFHTRATLIVFDGDNLAEALAELRLRCKENGYLPSKTDD